MNALLLVLTSMAFLFGGMFIYLAFTLLISVDREESDQVRAAVEERFPKSGGFLNEWRRYSFSRDRIRASQLQVGKHWQKRPAPRWFACLGVALIVIGLICSHFAVWPR